MTGWTLLANAKPPKNQQVLVELREGPIQVCDVACYVGKHEDGDRWVMADVRLDSRQIKRWAHIYPEPPEDERRKAFVAGWDCGSDFSSPNGMETDWLKYEEER